MQINNKKKRTKRKNCNINERTEIQKQKKNALKSCQNPNQMRAKYTPTRITTK